MIGKRIGVLTGGGDAPGLNAVIRAVVKTAGRLNWVTVGIEDGFEGLLGDVPARVLTLDDVRGLLPRGGSILGCTNRGHFRIRMADGKLVKDEAAYRGAIESCNRLGLDALIVIGGEGSQQIAYELFRMGLAVVGVPKTIDNDLEGTELTFGFDTALGIATEAIDRLHTTAESHDRVMFVEVMGRHAGWISLMSGIAGGADVILIPEIPFNVDKIAAKITERESSGRKFSIVVVAEGAHPLGGQEVYHDVAAADSQARLGGIADRVSRQVSSVTRKDTRVVVLGHVQRGGSPTAADRVLATAYGSAAVNAVAEGKFGHMVAWRSGAVSTVPLELCVKGPKTVPPDHFLISAARNLSISFAGPED